MLSDFEKRTILLRLERMVAHTYFSVTDVDSCLTIAGVPRPPHYEVWRAYHCIDWKDIPPDLRQELLMQIASYIGPSVGMEPTFFGEPSTPLLDTGSVEVMPEGMQASPAVVKSAESFKDKLCRFLRL